MENLVVNVRETFDQSEFMLDLSTRLDGFVLGFLELVVRGSFFEGHLIAGKGQFRRSWMSAINGYSYVVKRHCGWWGCSCELFASD